MIVLVGLAIVVISEAATLAHVEPFWSWNTPICWTGFILFADAVVFRARPVVPDLPQKAAQQSAEREIHQPVGATRSKVGGERFSAEPRIDGIEQKNESQPHGCSEIAGRP